MGKKLNVSKNKTLLMSLIECVYWIIELLFTSIDKLKKSCLRSIFFLISLKTCLKESLENNCGDKNEKVLLKQLFCRVKNNYLLKIK